MVRWFLFLRGDITTTTKFTPSLVNMINIMISRTQTQQQQQQKTDLVKKRKKKNDCKSINSL